MTQKVGNSARKKDFLIASKEVWGHWGEKEIKGSRKGKKDRAKKQERIPKKNKKEIRG